MADFSVSGAPVSQGWCARESGCADPEPSSKFDHRERTMVGVFCLKKKRLPDVIIQVKLNTYSNKYERHYPRCLIKVNQRYLYPKKYPFLVLLGERATRVCFDEGRSG